MTTNERDMVSAGVRLFGFLVFVFGVFSTIASLYIAGLWMYSSTHLPQLAVKDEAPEAVKLEAPARIESIQARRKAVCKASAARAGWKAAAGLVAAAAGICLARRGQSVAGFLAGDENAPSCCCPGPSESPKT